MQSKGQVMEWISVKERLPNVLEKPLLVFTDEKRITIAFLWEDEEWERDSLDIRKSSKFSWIIAHDLISSQEEFGGHHWKDLKEVLYWMPLPTPPEVNNGST